ncbi:MAG: DUF359 domain-containing protein [Candidatus Thermoplasmatota archaeon]|nr:DUF359 domain-containing protein [Candidatus Thermoplasmatota archaeon]MCL6091254.1 DUF359 domain-containing protein [Candidatus Thermoplasmatota archaeon]
MQLKSGSEFIISEDLRVEISKSNGPICSVESLSSEYKDCKIVSVGDVTTRNLHNALLTPFLEVVDLKTQRGTEGVFNPVPGSYKIRNNSGTLSHDLFMLIERLIATGGGRIEIDGEEDLAVIPIIFYSDKNTVVAYGIPNVGMACIRVDSEIKEHVKQLIERMEIKCQN